MGAAPTQEHPWRQGPPLGFLQLSGTQQSPRTPGAPFGLAPLPSLSQGASSGEPLDEADPETSPRSHHSSSKRHHSFMPLQTVVMVLPGFSRFVGHTSYRGCLLRGMNLYPLWIFWSFSYRMASQWEDQPTYLPIQKWEQLDLPI